MLNCTVKFDNRPSGIFYSGERVTGCITLILEKPMILKDLIFKSQGRSNCQWMESHGAGKTRVTLVFTAKDDHFKSSMSLLMQHARDALNDTVLLEAGSHSFPFSFSLPEELPTSFESYTGKVRYTIKVKAVRHKKCNEKYKTAYTVISKCDLNSIPNCNVPLNMEGRKGFNSFFVSKGALSMNVSLPMSGFLPGQQLPITYTISNISKVTVKQVIFSIVKIVTYSATSPWKKSRVERNIIVQYAGKGVNKMETASFPVSFSVPAVPPSSTMEKLPVTIQYELKVRARVSSMHSDVTIDIPIKIGNVPFRDTSRFYGLEPIQHFSSTAPSMAFVTPMYFDIPSISALKAANKKNGVIPEKKSDDLVFTPTYPIFSFPKS